MTALAADRNTPVKLGDVLEGAVAASVLIYAGALVMRNAAGFLTKGATATGAVAVGRADQRVDNTDGAAGDAFVRYRPGVLRYANSASADEITVTEIGDLCWVVDDQTVAKTDGTGARSPAGIVAEVDDLGVWVQFDEALTKTAAVAAAAIALASV